MTTARREVHPAAVKALKKLEREKHEHPARVARVRKRLGLRLREMCDVFGADQFALHKMETGAIRLTPVRVEILLALELAFDRATPAEVWGDRELSTGQRLARIFAYAYRPQVEAHRA